MDGRIVPGWVRPRLRARSVECPHGRTGSVVSLYDPIARIYDPWSRSVAEDIGFYVEEALAPAGLSSSSRSVRAASRCRSRRRASSDRRRSVRGNARGRASIRARARGREPRRPPRRRPAGAAGDRARPPRDLPVSLAPAHARRRGEADARSRRCTAARETAVSSSTSSLRARGHRETHGRWLEREPGIFERADWDETARTLTLSVRSGESAATMDLHWLRAENGCRCSTRRAWRSSALWGWFDRRPYTGGEDMVFACRRRG